MVWKSRRFSSATGRDRRRRKRKSAHRPGDVLELLLAEIDEFFLQLVAHLLVSRARQAKPARLANPLEPRGDVDVVAHEIAVSLLDDVAQMNADSKDDALVGRETGVAVDHRALDLDRRADRVDHAPELDDGSVAGALDDAAVMERDGRVDEVAAQRAQTRKRSLLVGAGEL